MPPGGVFQAVPDFEMVVDETTSRETWWCCWGTRTAPMPPREGCLPRTSEDSGHLAGADSLGSGGRMECVRQQRSAASSDGQAQRLTLQSGYDARLDDQSPETVARAFVEAINHRSVEELVALMTEDHVFIDGAGSEPRAGRR